MIQHIYHAADIILFNVVDALQAFDIRFKGQQ